MSAEPKKDMSAEMQRDLERWRAQQAELAKAEKAKEADLPSTFESARAALIAAFQQAPEKVQVPFHLTPQGERLARFKATVKETGGERFLEKIDRTKVPNVAAFDAVAKWDGTFPGPCAVGVTGSAKTRASWSALGRLYVYQEKAFEWFTAKRLVGTIARYDAAGHGDEFYRQRDFFPILFVDDIDKINWDFESEAAALFAFFDWVYRKNKACLVTTNRSRKWWTERMGDAFVRRLMTDACREVEF